METSTRDASATVHVVDRRAARGDLPVVVVEDRVQDRDGREDQPRQGDKEPGPPEHALAIIQPAGTAGYGAR